MTRANFLTQALYSYVFGSVLNYIDNIERRRSLQQYVKSMNYNTVIPAYTRRPMAMPYGGKEPLIL